MGMESEAFFLLRRAGVGDPALADEFFRLDLSVGDTFHHRSKLLDTVKVAGVFPLSQPAPPMLRRCSARKNCSSSTTTSAGSGMGVSATDSS